MRPRSHAKRQEGQVLLIFALGAVVVVGVVALALDFGLTSAHHRFLQNSADQAAIAGAARLPASPTASDYTAARTTAFIYLRDNVAPGGPTVSQVSAGGSNCDFSIGLNRCVLPGAQYSRYTISIQSPGKTPGGQAIPSAGQTVSVQVTEAVTAALGSVLGQATVNTTINSVAETLKPVFSTYALYVDGCLNIGNHLELVGGDVYVNQCTLNFQSQNQASFCAYGTPGQAGSLTFGPQANSPGITLLQNQTLAACRAGTADTIFALGSVITATTSIPPPAFAPPPNLPTCPGGGCVAAVANRPCLNGTKNSTNAQAQNCFDPGAYTTIGPIANNLNPGIYVINGGTCTSNCASVVFTGNTMNGNFSDVKDQCWSSPNNPGQGTWVAPCPDGFVSNPLVPVDPQCTGSTATALVAPVFTANPAAAGTLAAGTYYVRVTAVNALGESTSNETSATIPVLSSGQGSIALSIPYQAGATGYNIYGPSQNANQELGPTFVAQPVAPGVAAALTTLQGGATPYPVFNNSTCAAGFHNTPRTTYENYGVTFVMTKNAGFCLNSTCSGTPPSAQRPVVLLSPYCSKLSKTGQPPSTACPWVSTGPNINDGAFTITGNSQGSIQAAGTGTELNLTGTVFAPSMPLVIQGAGGQGQAKFHVIPGQVIVKSADVYSANNLDPMVYYGPYGAALPGYLRVVQ